MNSELDRLQTWVANEGTKKLSEADLLSLVISNPVVANEVIRDFGGLKGLANQPLEKFLRYNGLGDAKIIQMAACMELAKRVVDVVLQSLEFPAPSKNSQGGALCQPNQ